MILRTIHGLTVLSLMLLLGATPAAAQDTFEPNDTPEQAAGPMQSGVAYDSFIFSTFDIDWFYFDADVGTVQITLTNIPAGQDYDLSLFDDEGVLLFISDAPGNADESIVVEVTGGVARGFLLVEGFDGSFSQIAPYRLSAVFNDVNANTPPSVTVNSPNGGETLTGGSQFSIGYTASDPEDGGALSIDLEYSTNNGVSWTPIATGQGNTGSFSWTVPDVSSSSARVRVTATDSGGLSASDTSNNVFTIQPQVQNTPPTVAVLSPNGGQLLTGGQQTTIAYTANDGQDGTALFMSFEYSTNNGASWISIATGQSNTGSFSWTVPDLSTSAGRVRVTALDSGGLSTSDQSDAAFTIQPSSPLGNATLALATGVQVTAGQSVTIPVSLSHDQAVAGVQLTVGFDPAHLTPTGVTKGSRANAMTLGTNLSRTGEVILTLTSDSGQTIAAGGGTVAQITFSTPVTATGTRALTLSDVVVSDTSGRAMTLTTTNGSVIITGGVGPDLSLSIPSGMNAAPGSTFDVPVTFSSNVPVAAFQFVLNFDAAVLSPVSVTQGARAGSMTMGSNPARSGEVRVVFHFPSGGTLAAGSGTACTIRFQALAGAPGNTALSFSEVVASDAQGNALPVTAESKTVTAVTAVSLRVASVAEGLRLSWSAEADAGHLGFRILREEEGEPAAIHEGLLPAAAREYLDATATPGVTHRYWLEALDRSGLVQRFGPATGVHVPPGLRAGAAWPNPSRGEVRLEVSSADGNIEALVVDAAGRRVRDLEGLSGTGGVLRWDGRLGTGEPAPAGIYFLVIRSADSVITRRVVRTGS